MSWMKSVKKQSALVDKPPPVYKCLNPECGAEFEGMPDGCSKINVTSKFIGNPPKGSASCVSIFYCPFPECKKNWIEKTKEPNGAPVFVNFNGFTTYIPVECEDELDPY